MMIHLVYVSSATRKMSEDELLHLLQECRSRNKEQNVTGMLLYAGGNFFQVLEGDPKDVEDIYKSIVDDPRHKGPILVVKEKIDQRSFPDWTMGFRALAGENGASVGGYSEFLSRTMKPEEFTNHSDKVISLLYQFKDGNL